MREEPSEPAARFGHVFSAPGPSPLLLHRPFPRCSRLTNSPQRRPRAAPPASPLGVSPRRADAPQAMLMQQQQQQQHPPAMVPLGIGGAAHQGLAAQALQQVLSTPPPPPPHINPFAQPHTGARTRPPETQLKVGGGGPGLP